MIATAVSLGGDGVGNNTIYRGLIVRLDEKGDACVAFDADTMRLAGAWTDGSLALVGLPFTGGHGAYPSVRGDKVFHLGARPGWAKAGDLKDPRAGDYPPLGHLPKDWAHYKGLYMSGDKVVFKYTVGAADVWETSSLVSASDTEKAIVRTLRIARDGSSMTMVLANADANSAIKDAVADLGGDEMVTMVSARSSSAAG